MNISGLISTDEKLTVQQAYLAMVIFLDFQNKSCSNEMEVGQVLGECSITVDGSPADAAMWEDWLDAVEKARDERNWEIAKFEIIN